MLTWLVEYEKTTLVAEKIQTGVMKMKCIGIRWHATGFQYRLVWLTSDGRVAPLRWPVEYQGWFASLEFAMRYGKEYAENNQLPFCPMLVAYSPDSSLYLG